MFSSPIKPGVSSGRERNVSDADSRLDALLLSERRIADLAAFCLSYEFEDTFAAVSNAKRIDAIDLPALEFSRRVYKLARLASGSPGLARQVAPAPRNKVVLEQNFELFFPVFNNAHELYSLTTIPNWRQCMPQGRVFHLRSPGRIRCRSISLSSYLHLTTSSLGPAKR